MTAEVHHRPDPAPIVRVPIVDVDLPPSIPPSEVGGDIMDGEEAGGKKVVMTTKTTTTTTTTTTLTTALTVPWSRRIPRVAPSRPPRRMDGQ